jgi:obg-like ATPase 1
LGSGDWALVSGVLIVWIAYWGFPGGQRKKNKWLIKIHEWVKAHGGGVIIPFSGQVEQAILDMPEEDVDMYCSELGVRTPPTIPF